MLQTFKYQNNPITFDLNGEVMVNATQMAKPFFKVPNEFLRLPSTIEYLEALQTTTGKSRSEIVKVQNGGTNPGTWFCQKLTISFAQWLSATFSVWVDTKIEELLTSGKTEIKPLSDAEMRLHVFKQLEQEAESLKEQNKLLETTIKQQAPKVEYVDKVLNAANLITSTVVAADFGKSADWLHKTLKGMHIMWKVGGTWVLTSRYADKGYTQSKTHPYTDSLGQQKTSIQTYWTEKGRAFLHHKLKEFLPAKAA
jgi:phage antirepressor YoqD-like protein